MWKQFVAFMATLLCAFSVQAAALMGFADSVMVMGEATEDYQEVMANYSPVIGRAYGVEFMRMRDKDGMLSSISALNYTHIFKRWNMPGGQANLWFTGGIGESHGDGQSGFAWTPGVQFDYETKRLYFLAKMRMVRAPGMNFDTAAVQAGFSFYETSFDETQPWFVLEAKTMNNMDPGFQLTPSLRFINKNYFIEAGVTQPFDREARMPRLSLMFVF